MAGCIFDVTESRLAAQLAYTETEMAMLTLASMREAVIRTDVAGRVTYCNLATELVLGKSEADLLGLPIDEVCNVWDASDGQQKVSLSEQLFADHGPNALKNPLLQNTHLIRADGTRCAVEYSISPLHLPDGAVAGALIMLHDVSEFRRQTARLEYRAHYDGLTKLLNRHGFEQRLLQLSEDGMDPDAEHAVMFIDLDHFKPVNDTYGHSAGDAFLLCISDVLEKSLRRTDIVARLGGDEFVVVLPHCPAAHATRIAENIRRAISNIAFEYEGHPIRASSSIGLVCGLMHRAVIADILKTADAACYMAKHQGRNRVYHLSLPDELPVRQGLELM
jgi:diguanylate cyclase (GGDEF)-like protein/PAS domain S-box-containing protein